MSKTASESDTRRWAWLGWALLVTVATLVGFWAGRVALAPPTGQLEDSTEPITYEVRVSTVQRTMQFVAAAEWQTTPMATSEAIGVVTSVDIAFGDVVGSGDVLFAVNLRPVVAVSGEVPAFREMLMGVSGPDVLQLQQMLSEAGLYSGQLSGVYDTGTRAGVRSWQRELGIVDDGVVRYGDLVFLPGLPERVALGDEIAVGSRLRGGEVAVLSVPESPSFWIPLSTDQAPLIPLAAPVMISYAEGVWTGRIQQVVERGLGRMDLLLTAFDGGPVCGSDCRRWVDAADQTNFGAEVLVVSPVEGPALPVAAIQTGADGRTFVTLANGERRFIQVVASVGGTAIVEGVAVGDVVVLPIPGPPRG